jgi:hypothetical protein
MAEKLKLWETEQPLNLDVLTAKRESYAVESRLQIDQIVLNFVHDIPQRESEVLAALHFGHVSNEEIQARVTSGKRRLALTAEKSVETTSMQNYEAAVNAKIACEVRQKQQIVEMEKELRGHEHILAEFSQSRQRIGQINLELSRLASPELQKALSDAEATLQTLRRQRVEVESSEGEARFHVSDFEKYLANNGHQLRDCDWRPGREDALDDLSRWRKTQEILQAQLFALNTKIEAVQVTFETTKNNMLTAV